MSLRSASFSDYSERRRGSLHPPPPLRTMEPTPRRGEAHPPNERGHYRHGLGEMILSNPGGIELLEQILQLLHWEVRCGRARCKYHRNVSEQNRFHRDGEVKTLAYLLHNVTIEVDMSDVENARDLDASRLRLNGHFEVFGGVETRGLRRWVFKVHQATRLGE